MASDAVHAAVTVAAAPRRAFAVFAEGLSSWWPPEYTWSQGVLDTIAIEPREGGACYEVGPRGFRCDWGRVLSWEPPGRLVFSWQISPRREPEPDPARASEVEVRFRASTENGSSTRVELEHRGFDRHGADGDGYRAALESPQGWPLILARYAESFG